jgi:3-oxoacyl-[acyl-carrier protein] reductase
VDLHGRIALVTGGGTGMGREISRRIAARGARVAISYSRSESEAHAAASEIDARAFQADVRNLEDINALVASTTRELGGLDVLVNCVGLTRFIDFENLDAVTEEVWDAILDVNLKGAFFVSRAVGLWMRQTSEQRPGGGVIVNVSSTAAFSTRGSSIPYNIAKAGVVQMTRTLAQALAPAVRVNCVAPGTVPTRWWDHGPPGALDRAIANSKFKRLTAAEDVADAVLLLVENDSLSGQTLAVDLASVMH